MSVGAISAMQHQAHLDNASVAVAKKSLQSTRMQGQQALKLIDAAVDGAPRPAGDGRGTLVNTYA